jgi:hypothetical protein
MRIAPLFLVVAACGLYFGPSGEPAPSLPPPSQADARPRPAPTNDVDLLFVIESAHVTIDVQTLFAQNLPALVARLDALPAGRPNLHIGVTTTSVSIGSADFGASCATGDDGLLQNRATVAGCAPPSDRYIVDVADPTGGRMTNYPATESLDQAMQCIAGVGADGCGFIAPLEAMKRALDGSQPGNASFLRNGAALVVVVIAQDDDCSADTSLFAVPSDQAGPGTLRCAVFGYACNAPISPTQPGDYTSCAVRTGAGLRDVAGYVDFLTTLRDPARLGVVVIAGDPSDEIRTATLDHQVLSVLPSCTATINGNYEIAQPGDRLWSFAARLGTQGASYADLGVCTGDESPYMAELADVIGGVMR